MATRNSLVVSRIWPEDHVVYKQHIISDILYIYSGVIAL